MTAFEAVVLFRLPTFRRRAQVAAEGQESTDAVVAAAKELKGKADDVIRAAYALADSRVREERPGGARRPEQP